jgi:hypothetical protein
MEYSNAIILKFQNAGSFRKYWKNKDNVLISGSKDDRVLTVKSRELRTKNQYIDCDVNTLHQSFVENCIMVLTGRRPVSKYRDTCCEKDNGITDISLRALVKIESLTTKNKDGNDILIYEKMTTRKCLDNSWNQVSPSWIRMKYLLPKELYDNLVSVARTILSIDNVEDILLSDVCDKLFESNNQLVIELVSQAREFKCEPLAKLLTGSKVHSLQQCGYNGLGPYLRTLVTKGVADIARIDGRICIPLTNEELEMFRAGNGCATILEGGVVTIEHIENLEYVSLNNISNGYVPVQV